jgi:hypothetical protein
MWHRNGRMLEPPHDEKYMLKVGGMFAQGWRSPSSHHVQKVASFVVYLKTIFL